MLGCYSNQASSNKFSEIYPDFCEQKVNNIIVLDDLDRVISKQYVKADFLQKICDAKGIVVKFYPTKRIILLQDSIKVDSIYFDLSKVIKYNGSTFKLEKKIW